MSWHVRPRAFDGSLANSSEHSLQSYKHRGTVVYLEALWCFTLDGAPVVDDMPKTALHLRRCLATVLGFRMCSTSTRHATSAIVTSPAPVVTWPQSIHVNPMRTSPGRESTLAAFISGSLPEYLTQMSHCTLALSTFASDRAEVER